MKRLSSILSIFVICSVVLLTVTACQLGTSNAHLSIPIIPSSPVTEESPDDIVPTPGGSAYRANVHQPGIGNPWPSIETVEVQLGSGSNIFYVRYRNHIVTKAGETRHNIFNVRKESGFFQGGGSSRLNLYINGTPSGLHLSQEGGGGLPGTLATVLAIEIPKAIKPDKYNLKIGLEIEGKDYGTILCTIEVVK